MSKKAAQTPMMKQYYDLKEQYRDAILFFRLGDFYEMFDDDALEAAKVLEITLTARNKQADNPIPMCGVPHHSATEYIKRLINEGYKVAIAEQMEDPSQTKGMVHREVVRVITPGTILEEDAIPTDENNYLATIYHEAKTYHLAYLDVSTGEGYYTQTNDWHQFLNELLSIQPTEVVVSTEFDNDLLEQIQENLTSYYTVHPLSQESPTPPSVDWSIYSTQEQQLLHLCFDYLYSVQKQTMTHLQPLQAYELSQYLQMNHFTKRQLELTRSLRTQRKKGSLLWLIDQTKTAMGGRLLHQWLDKPLLYKEPLLERHNKVEHLLNHYFERLDLIESLSNVYDLERLVTKISYHTANARDLDQLRSSLNQLPQLNKILTVLNQSNEVFELLDEFTELKEQLEKTLTDEPPISITEGGLIKPGVNETLDNYHDALTNGKKWLADLQTREREKTGLRTLKVGYNRVFGYYIEISRLQAEELEDERYERKQTLANSERFITQELKEIETTILNAQERAIDLEYELFLELRAELQNYIPGLQQLAQEVAQLDVLANFATVSEEEGYVRCQIADSAKNFHLTDSRHPAVEKLIGKANFVPNDLDITPDHSLLLLTGPNMSGKSTYMRQVAFCIILNQIGCFVPAKAATLPLIDQIFTRIGSSDDIASGQSTFMVEMMETNYALTHATEQSLLLFDEIGRGTATFDGMALAEAILSYIHDHVKAATIFSTHYHELTQLEETLPHLVNIHVGAKEEDGELVFEHRVLEGSADRSYGIHVAQLAGLPLTVIEKSHRILTELEHNSQYLRQPQTTQQLDLFTASQEPALSPSIEKLINQLDQLDINHLTPLEALQQLVEFQQLLQK